MVFKVQLISGLKAILVIDNNILILIMFYVECLRALF